ncbi:7784_t:CDS:1, partial [Paraglomus occultum]
NQIWDCSLMIIRESVWSSPSSPGFRTGWTGLFNIPVKNVLRNTFLE